MLSSEHPPATQEQIEAVSANLHDLVIGFASDEQYVNSRVGFRRTTTEWQLPIDNGNVGVRTKTDFTKPRTELPVNSFSDVTLELPVDGDGDFLEGFGKFRLEPERGVDTMALIPDRVVVAGKLTVEDLLDAVGAATADEFLEWVNGIIPNATSAEIRRYALFTEMTGQFTISAALHSLKRDGVTESSQGVRVEHKGLFNFKSELSSASRLGAVEYCDTRDYLGPLGIPADKLRLFPNLNDGSKRLFAPPSSRELRPEAETINNDRKVLTIGRLQEVKDLGLAAVQYARGYLAGEVAHRRGGTAQLSVDAGEPTRRGYEAGLAYRPF